jgi:transcriptional regulator with XRE-family HTH domain
MPDQQPTLGTVLRNLRTRFGWTLKEMSAKSGIPMSTLSKVEHDRLTLTYDKLQQLSQRLSIRMSDLFAEGGDAAEPPPTGRRSIGRLGEALRVNTPNYDYHYLCTELRQKLMIPLVTRIRARTLEEFGALVRHPGEEVIYVLEGRIEVHTAYYDPVILEKGEAIYIDSTMGHAYLAADGCEEAVVLGVCSSVESDLMDSFMSIHQEAGL